MSNSAAVPTGLAHAVARALRLPVGFGVGAAVVLALAPVVLDAPAGPDLDAGAAPGPAAAAERTREDVAGVTAARLVRDHDCWTGEAPADLAGGLPGHVVLTRLVAGEERTTYGADRLVGVALEHLFSSPDPQVVAVHGFCR